VILDEATGDVVDQVVDNFDINGLYKQGQLVLFQIEIQGKGQIILDLF